MIAPCLYIAETPKMGKGVFTSAPITAGSVIEIAPVIVMPAADRLHLDQTLLHDYIFEWGEHAEHCALALGWVSVYNHAYLSNCEYEMDFESATIRIKTVRDIQKGEELFVNYNASADDATPIWFEAK